MLKYRQLANGIKTKIKNGEYPADTRLPSIRQTAKEYNVNTATVINAYKCLESEGCVYTRGGSGTYVLPGLQNTGETVFLTNEGFINFAGTETDPTLFPSESFGECVQEVLDIRGKAGFGFIDCQGYLPLREVLAQKNNTDPRQIILLTGIQQGLDILKGFRSKYRIKEDLYGDFYYAGNPPQILCDIYIKSYAKIFVPGLAYMVVPRELTQKLAIPEHCPSFGFIQQAFHLFLQNGGFDEHTANMRNIYGKRYRRVLTAVRGYLADYAGFNEPESGLGITIKPNNVNPEDIDGLCRRLLERNVIVSPGNSCFNINFASTREERINEGVGIIAAVLAEGMRNKCWCESL
jgi:DNA-binding transcriptional MocR family regulator